MSRAVFIAVFSSSEGRLIGLYNGVIDVDSCYDAI